MGCDSTGSIAEQHWPNTLVVIYWDVCVVQTNSCCNLKPLSSFLTHFFLNMFYILNDQFFTVIRCRAGQDVTVLEIRC